MGPDRPPVLGRPRLEDTREVSLAVRAGGALLTVAVAIVAAPFVLALLLLSGAAASTCAPAPSTDDRAAGLDAEQTRNAAVIVGAAKTLFATDGQRASLVALATALQESGLRNLDHGDRDSVGLFQQRPSAGWGTVEQIMDPAYAAGRFYRALTDVSGWRHLPVTAAAQAVQISAFPGAYAKWEPLAAGTSAALWPSAAPVSIPQAVGWLGEPGSPGAEAPATGGCVASGELVLPLPAGYSMSDGYGWRNLGMGTNPFHRGVDLVADCGTPVFAMMSGTVVSVDRLTILIETPGIARIGYLHTSQRDHLVRPGDGVVAGQQVSSVGSEPPSTGCHLDIRMDTGGATDPRAAGLVPAPGAGHSWVNPESFTHAFGVELCPSSACRSLR